jgi:glycerate-2-kinase
MIPLTGKSAQGGDSMPYVKNTEQLSSHGDRAGRKIILSIIESALAAVDPYLRAKQVIYVQGSTLHLDRYAYDLDTIKHIYVVGAGKGSFSIAQALEEILGTKIEAGAVIVKKGDARRLTRIQTIEAGHPLPDEMSIIGALAIIEIAKMATEEDLVLAAFTGGSSALAELPEEGITLEDIVKMNTLLLDSGAVIRDINTVRKHVSRIKGGRLVTDYILPADMVTLTLNTAPEGLPWPDLSYPDPSTFEDALRVLKRYDLLERMPKKIVERLEWGMQKPERETPKDFGDFEIKVVGLGNQRIACEAALAKAKDLGFHGAILGVDIEGEAKDVGVVMAGIAKEIHRNGRPFPLPCVLISGGEATVSLPGRHGSGGPNQETALSIATKISECEGIVAACIDTDGTDGPTEVAGGMVDSHTFARSCHVNIDVFDTLKAHDSSTALLSLDDAIVTGHTGTNVMNLRVILIGKPK